jgi:hypothetical protein
MEAGIDPPPAVSVREKNGGAVLNDEGLPDSHGGLQHLDFGSGLASGKNQGDVLLADAFQRRPGVLERIGIMVQQAAVEVREHDELRASSLFQNRFVQAHHAGLHLAVSLDGLQQHAENGWNGGGHPVPVGDVRHFQRRFQELLGCTLDAPQKGFGLAHFAVAIVLQSIEGGIMFVTRNEILSDPEVA